MSHSQTLRRWASESLAPARSEFLDVTVTIGKQALAAGKFSKSERAKLWAAFEDENVKAIEGFLKRGSAWSC